MDTMRRFLISLTALGLLGAVLGCRVIGDGIDSDCGCEACGCAGGGCDAPLPDKGPATPATLPATPAAPESIKEMPKVIDNSSSIKNGSDEAPITLTPEPDGLDLK
jgi:hypothetical protein